MSFTTVGRIQQIYAPQTIQTSNGQPYTFAEIDLAVVGYQNRTDVIHFRVSGNTLGALSTLRQGQEVEAKFDIRCRQWTDKDNKVRWSTDLIAWDLKPYMVAQPPTQGYPAQPMGGYGQQYPQQPQQFGMPNNGMMPRNNEQPY